MIVARRIAIGERLRFNGGFAVSLIDWDHETKTASVVLVVPEHDEGKDHEYPDLVSWILGPGFDDEAGSIQAAKTQA